MSVTTLRPNGTNLSAGVALTGGATAHAVTSDNSDSSYVTFEFDFATADELTLDFGTFSLPTGAVVSKVLPRVRIARTAAGSSGITITPAPHGAANAVVVNWTSPTTISLATEAEAFTQADVDDLTLNLFFAAAGILRLYEAYLDLTYVARPVTNVTAPVDPVADTNLPVVAWANTLDSDGGAQTTFEAKVFTFAQFSAGGFDPATSTPYETSGEVSSSAGSWTPTVIQPDVTYRAYVRVAQTVNGALHWSDWDHVEYDLAVALPAVPTLTLTEDENDGRIIIDLDDNSGDATTDAFELQRSTDGTTWEPVRLTTDTAGVIAGTTAAVYDYEAPNGTATLYRARALHDYSGVYAASDWATGTATFSTADVWLKAPERPALNMIVDVDSYAAHTRQARRGVFQALGRTDVIVVRDKRGPAQGTVRLRLDTFAEQETLDALIDSGLTLLLQVPASDSEPDRYVQLGDHERARIVDKGFVEGTFDTLAWVEVAAPTGVVDDWPAGTS